MGHDPLCPVGPLDAGFEVCCCDLILRVRENERQEMADNLWQYIQPIVDWIAGVNMTKEAK